MSKWADVGEWLKGNAGTGTALVGSLLTGNVPAAVAAGVSLVSSATGSNDPSSVLANLQTNPESMVKLKELYYQNEDNVRKHIQEITRLELEDEQKKHEQTQLTIRNGDNADDRLVRWTRPLQSWGALLFTFWYIYSTENPDVYVLGLFLALPYSYAGLREIGKGITSVVEMRKAKK